MRNRKGQGSRSRQKAKQPYNFVPRYVALTGTERHCYIHPAELATAWELNTQDKSYRRPVCVGCAA